MWLLLYKEMAARSPDWKGEWDRWIYDAIVIAVSREGSRSGQSLRNVALHQLTFATRKMAIIMKVWCEVNASEKPKCTESCWVSRVFIKLAKQKEGKPARTTLSTLLLCRLGFTSGLNCKEQCWLPDKSIAKYFFGNYYENDFSLEWKAEFDSLKMKK